MNGNKTLLLVISRIDPGAWGDVNTDGLGLLEMMQWGLDMNLTTVLGAWGGL